MFGGEETKVRLEFKNELVGVLLDRFGKDIRIFPADEEGWYVTEVELAFSDQFFGWIFPLGNKVKIIGPEGVVERFRSKIMEMNKMYQ